MQPIHQTHVADYHRAMASTGHHGSHNMHIFHRDWHRANLDPRPPIRPDSNWGANLVFGTNFLQMHHEMVKAPRDEARFHMMHDSLVQWYRDSEIALPLEWNPATTIPDELGYVPDINEFPDEIREPLIQRAERQGVTADSLLQRRTNNPNLLLPAWFTRAGVPAGERGEPITGARKLADFKNSNQLGCCIVFPHNSWHGMIGGAMGSTWTAIADPIFYFGVHWIIDRVFDEFKLIEAERRIQPLDFARLNEHKALPTPIEEREIRSEFSADERALLQKWQTESEEFNRPLDAE